jgi:hypothetical protein
MTSYSDARVTGEVVGSGNDSIFPIVDPLTYYPIVPTTLKITFDGGYVTDNGYGDLRGDGMGSIDYETGALDLLLLYPLTKDAIISASYTYDAEALMELQAKETLDTRRFIYKNMAVSTGKLRASYENISSPTQTYLVQIAPSTQQTSPVSKIKPYFIERQRRITLEDEV